jgi:hypothetical protein
MGLLGKVGCDNMKLEERTSQLNAELMQANLDKGRAETQFGNAEKYIGELEESIQEEIKAREAEVTRYGELSARYTALKKKKQATKTEIVYRDGPVVEVPADLKLVTGLLYQATSPTTLVSIGELFGEYQDHRLYINARVLPFPNEERSTKWEFGYQLNLKLQAQFVETITPTGAINHYAKIYEVDETGKKVGEFKLDSFKYVVENPNQKQWFWWAPHLDVGALGMAGTLPPRFTTGGSVGVSFFGYGLTVNDLDWRVLRVSLDLSDGLPGIGLSPVAYNLGALIPLISNLWIAPHVHYGLEGEWKAGLFIGAVL